MMPSRFSLLSFWCALFGAICILLIFCIPGRLKSAADAQGQEAKAAAVALKIEAAAEALDAAPTDAIVAEAAPATNADSYSGMGGVDTAILSGQLDELLKKPEIIPELYYELYTVQEGDMVGRIAARYGVSQDAIISLNKLRNTRSLQIGQILKIPTIDGILYTTREGDTPASIADQYRISLEKIAIVNNIPDNRLEAGLQIFLPDAKLDWLTIQEINGDLFKNPLRGGYWVSSNYGWRNNPFSGKRTFHNGIDMACPTGTPIYAAMPGTVIAAGYNATYGNYVTLQHHSGYQTLYAHMSKILVSNGQHVTTNSRVGLVGNTGQSTGPHLHFTVFKNKSSTNPVLWH